MKMNLKMRCFDEVPLLVLMLLSFCAASVSAVEKMKTESTVKISSDSDMFGMFSQSSDDLYKSVFQLPILQTSSMTSYFYNSYTCGNTVSSRKKLNDFHYRGTALGGWLVLEPWITPSLFYQFLGASKKWGNDAKNRVGFDSKTFCTGLGKEEANRQLRAHWKSWVTEEEIVKLKKTGITTLRIPVADWMYQPYEPYIGCWDGSLEELDRVLDLMTKHGMKGILDVHTQRDSQNGLDNSGDTSSYKWVEDYDSAGAAIYNHWDIRGANWIGTYNQRLKKYDNINTTNFLHSLRVVDVILDRYQDNEAVIGVEPVNEPWDATPIDVLKEFYWRVYKLVQLKAPTWLTLLHDSFRPSPKIWQGFLDRCDNFALDTHIYHAWAWKDDPYSIKDDACNDGKNLRLLESLGIPIIVGEWSLATDNCAMWLNGFNDNVPTYPKVECKRIKCPNPYMNEGGYQQPGAPPDPKLGPQDPFGTGGKSYVEYGTCPIDKPFEDDNGALRMLALAQMNSFDHSTHGQFFWNFRTELEARWSYMEAVKNKWIPVSAGDSQWLHKEDLQDIVNICPKDMNPPSTLWAANPMGMADAQGLPMWPLVLMMALAGVLGVCWYRRSKLVQTQYNSIGDDVDVSAPYQATASSPQVEGQRADIELQATNKSSPSTGTAQGMQVGVWAKRLSGNISESIKTATATLGAGESQPLTADSFQDSRGRGTYHN